MALRRVGSLRVGDLSLAECCAREGILSALETAHALAGARREAAERSGGVILIGLSGRGDKDLATLMEEARKAS